MSFMENHVLGEKSPLFGRRTGQLKINPLDYYDAAKFYPDASIERIIPFGANALKGKKSQYQITENFIAFWYRYVFSVRTEIERGNGDIYYALSLNNLPEFIGPVFEEITRQYLRRLNAEGKLPFIAKSFGKWWGRGRQGEAQEIDIVVESVTGKELIVGECKWKNSLKIKKPIETLQERTSYFDKYRSYKYLFTKSPVDIEPGQEVAHVSLSEYFN